ncbi:DMT family transporter [Pararhizobium mangrovi]|uniref:Multidrug efflux SMR transporter n=1 Tax=Pararhizobium mangrovi TaxID=2590452 RepID=A0A506UCR5_9HYPH|nr:multidrug efflux SMR transporter [Pararhizobium mangrovi]TPW31206.1 multidrug efflux SMR transporter [Pararhizobium mangrovi]
MTYFLLFVAVCFEVVATSALKQTAGFTRLLPSTICIVGYALAIYFLSLTVRSMPVGVIYAIWSGTGIVLIATIGVVFLGERLDAPAVIGLALIIAGIIIVNLFSRNLPH